MRIDAMPTTIGLSRDCAVSQGVCWKFVGTFLIVTMIGGATDT